MTWLFGLVLAAALIALAVYGVRNGWSAVPRLLEGLNPTATIAAAAILPLLGFSIVAVYLVIGAKFGLWLGGAVIAGISLFHLLASHAISQSFLRGPLLRALARHRKHAPEVPRGEEAAVAAMAALLPGVPYFARNYLLALSGIPLRTYLPICLPIYVLRSYVTLSVGDLGAGLTSRKMVILALVFAAKVGICALLFARIRHRLHRATASANALH